MRRLGLIGVGAWGRRYIDTIRGRTDCCIAAFTRASARTEEGIEGATPIESWQMLVAAAAAGDLDGVIAATTPQHQAEVGLTCASLGVALLVEKPLGLSRADVERVRARHDQSEPKAPLLVDYIHLSAPAYAGLKQRVADVGGAGSIVGVSTEGYNSGPLRSWSSLYDYGPHDLSMTLGLLGTDASFSLRDARRMPASRAGCELFDVRFEMAGVPVHMRVGNDGATKARRFAVSMSGERDVVYDDTQPHPLKLVDGGEPVQVDEGSPLDAVVARFLEMIELWRAGQLSSEAAGASLALSARVNGILDEIAASFLAGR